MAFSIRANASPFHLDWRQRFDRRLALSLAPCSFPSGNAAASDETELVPLMRTGVDLIIIFPSPAPVDGLPRGLVSAFPPAFPVRPLGFCQLRRSVGWRACSRVFCRARSRLISLTGNFPLPPRLIRWSARQHAAGALPLCTSGPGSRQLLPIIGDDPQTGALARHRHIGSLGRRYPAGLTHHDRPLHRRPLAAVDGPAITLSHGVISTMTAFRDAG